MATNRDILKEAIADAKAIKEAAIANAKVALEETFTPYLKEKLSAKLAEIDEMDNADEELDEMKDMEKDMYENMDEDMYEEKDSMDEEMDLDELLRELDDMEEVINDPRGDGAHGNIAPSSESDTDLMEGEEDEEEFDLESYFQKANKEYGWDFDMNTKVEGDFEDGNAYALEYGDESWERKFAQKLMNIDELPYNKWKVAANKAYNKSQPFNESKETEEEFDIENMSEDDLKSFIEDVISDMIEAGEIEGGHEGMEDEEEEEEVDLDELLAEMEGLDEYAEESPEQVLALICADYPEHKACKSLKEAKKMKKEMEDMDELNEKQKLRLLKPTKVKDSDSDTYYEKHEKMKEELEEAYRALAKIKSELNEVNLLNSKLLYSNKVFKAKNLTESQKVKVLAAFDKASTKKEAQLVYETVMENLNTQTTTKRPVTESVRGMASKVISGVSNNTKQPIIEVNAAFARMQQLAGIKK